MDQEVKVWRCKNGHVLGRVQRNGSGIRQLMLYREADPEEIDVIAVIEGYVADVRCSLCGSFRTWVPGQEAMDRLIRQVEKMRRAADSSSSSKLSAS